MPYSLRSRVGESYKRGSRIEAPNRGSCTSENDRRIVALVGTIPHALRNDYGYRLRSCALLAGSVHRRCRVVVRCTAGTTRIAVEGRGNQPAGVYLPPGQRVWRAI